AFAIVCAGIIILRRRMPDLQRPFRTPWVPLVPILGVISCVVLMVGLPWTTWIRLAIWLVLGFAIYFGYGQKHSRLNAGRDPA
ncbi:MAG: amino acid transporter, partial [Proteobacteria bacterium]|nr:amino acid transporter [Pseudomonadota bacterium]